MVRWLKTDIGAIGFHAIPKHVEDGTPYQTEAELCTPMSGGCQRQANLGADFMWDFGQIGTPVVVLLRAFLCPVGPRSNVKNSSSCALSASMTDPC